MRSAHQRAMESMILQPEPIPEEEQTSGGRRGGAGMGERSPWVRNVAAESLADLATIPGVAGLERGGRKPRMMVVDDDAGFRTMLRDWLEEEQVRVVAEAADGAKAVELATDTSPDLILMDLRMPKL